MKEGESVLKFCLEAEYKKDRFPAQAVLGFSTDAVFTSSNPAFVRNGQRKIHVHPKVDLIITPDFKNHMGYILF
jgi:hypothetical protein